MKVKCAECGLLAAREISAGVFVEVHRHAREKGELHRLGPTSHECPVCFVDAADLFDEWDKQPKKKTNQEKILGVVARERECPEFCKWHKGFSPKEHAQMIQMKLLREEMEARRMADEKRAEQRRLDDEKRAEDSRKEDKRQAEERLANDRAWHVEQEEKKFRRDVYKGVAFLILATVFAVLAEPWKTKQNPPPQIIVMPPPVDQRE
jgi:hypothetical protein